MGYPSLLLRGMKMKLLTTMEIQEAGQKSPKAALKCSIEHWQQICNLTPKKFIACWGKTIDVHGGYCALCVRYNKSSNCSKRCLLNGSCCPEWSKASGALDSGNLGDFHKAAKKMLAKLQKTYDGRYRK